MIQKNSAGREFPISITRDQSDSPTSVTTVPSLGRKDKSSKAADLHYSRLSLSTSPWGYSLLATQGEHVLRGLGTSLNKTTRVCSTDLFEKVKEDSEPWINGKHQPGLADAKKTPAQTTQGVTETSAPQISLKRSSDRPAWMAHLAKQLFTVKDLSDEKCMDIHLSKLAPAKMRAMGSQQPPAMGCAIIQEYHEAESPAQKFMYELGRKIQGIGIRTGIMGSSEQPMQIQRNIHSTITTLILDCPTVDDLAERLNTLNQTAPEVTAVLRSDELSSLKLRMTEWKINSDGNFGIQFDCCDSQNHTFRMSDIAQMLKDSPANLQDTAQAFTLNSIRKQGQLSENGEEVTLTRLQKVRLDLALAGAEVKSYWPGTFMVLAWTKNATALKSHPALNRFLTKVDMAIRPHLGHTHNTESAIESFSEERTMDHRHCIVNGKIGNMISDLPLDVALNINRPKSAPARL